MALALLCVVGALLRLEAARESLLADELATYWDVSGRSFGDLLSTIHSDAEISPPLGFVLAWLGTKLGSAPELLRAASLVAGIATIPLVYAIGRRVSGAPAGLVAAALVTFAPFMVFYSSEARGYAVAMAFVALSTLALVIAAEGGRTRWWVLYAIGTCGAAYTHYTTVFVLVFQLGWVLWAHPGARRGALLANVAAALAYVPWLSGFRADLDSPTTAILSALQPFSLATVGESLLHWSVAYPYAIVEARELPGKPALLLLAVGLALAAGGAIVRARRSPERPAAASGRDIVLIAGLALCVPVGEALISLVGADLFSTRNLAASWPGLALAIALVIVSAGPRVRLAAAALVIAAFAIGALKGLEDRHQRPAYDQVAAYINERSRPGDVIIDETAVVSPGPLSSIDPYLEPRGPVFRSLQPQQRVRPFSITDPIVQVDEAARRAVAAARGRRIFLATDVTRVEFDRPMGRYRPVERRTWPGIFRVAVQVYEAPASSRE